MRKSGFTLLEIILAVSVLALVATMIYGGFAQTALNKARVEGDVDQSRIVHMALGRMARELTMAFVSTHTNPSLELRVVETAFIGKDRGKEDDPRRGGKSQILVENVEEFNIEYFDPLLSEWVQTWDTEDVLAQPNRLPTQVRIRLAVKHPSRRGETQAFGTRVTIPLNYALNHANYNP